MVKLIHQNGNFLLRGNIPFESDVFLFSFLKETIEKKLVLQGLTPPREANYLIFSFLTDEREDEWHRLNTLRKTAEGFSPPSPHSISFGNSLNHAWWRIRAHCKLPQEPFNEDAVSQTLISKIENCPQNLRWFSHQSFNGEPLAFAQLVETLGFFMQKQCEVPLIIYIHCRHGRNRTTAAACAYRMRFLGEAFDEAYIKEAPPEVFEPYELLYYLFQYQALIR